jgi:NAD-dependent deacetylase
LIKKQKKYKSIVILTGAGISAESGLKTFRDSDGLWENHRIEDVATPEGFLHNPELVYEFYNQRRSQILNDGVKPNKAHLALAELEKQFRGKFMLITQNVDNLHERAGSQNIIHMHGELLKVRCKYTESVYKWEQNLNKMNKCNCCGLEDSLRPHIVWFGEIPLQMAEISLALKQADLFISIGTSGQVYPAAGFVREARFSGAHTVELNLEPSKTQSHFAEHHHGMASETVPSYIASLLALLEINSL